jgi:hypothetical protein
MPCSDSGPDIGYYVDRANKAARVACELWKVLKPFSTNVILTEETFRWVREHEEIDRKREEAEQKEAKRQAMLKCPACTCLVKAHHGPKIGCEGAGGNCFCNLTEEQVKKLIGER